MTMLAGLLATLAMLVATRVARWDSRADPAGSNGDVRRRVVNCAAGAALAAMAGSLLAHHLTYVEPARFTATESGLLLCAVVIGGPARWGPLASAALLAVMASQDRLAPLVGLDLSEQVSEGLAGIVLGSLLVLVVARRARAAPSARLGAS